MPKPSDLEGSEAAVAGDLRQVIGRLIRRLRVEHSFPISQGTVLSRIDLEGPKTTSQLAQSERVRPQSMAQTVGEMESKGLVSRRPDPEDRRAVLIELTAEGHEVLNRSRRNRDGWLTRAIEEELTPEERRTLESAVPLLEKISQFESDGPNRS